MKKDDDEAQQIYRGADQSDSAGAGSGIIDGGRVPQARCEQCAPDCYHSEVESGSFMMVG